MINLVYVSINKHDKSCLCIDKHDDQIEEILESSQLFLGLFYIVYLTIM